MSPQQKKPDASPAPVQAEPLVSSGSPEEAKYRDLAERIKNAHDPETMGTVSSVAKALGISTSALSRIRSGDLKAASAKTLQKIVDFYQLDFSEASVVAAHQAPSGKAVRVLAFCPRPECTTCIYVLMPDDEDEVRWLGRPRVLRIPQVLLAREGGLHCRECNKILLGLCPHCSEPFGGGSFCPFCGHEYVPVAHLPEPFLQMRYDAQDPATQHLDVIHDW